MGEERTTAVVQGYLDELAGDRTAEPVIRALLEQAAHRLHELCAALAAPELPAPDAATPQPPGGGNAWRGGSSGLLKALRQVRPGTVRQFFALASQHMRWELNEMARRLDEQPTAAELREGLVPAPASSDSQAHGGRPPDAGGDRTTAGGRARGVRAVRIQGMSQAEAARMLDVSVATVNRRLNRGLQLLAAELGDLYPDDEDPAKS